MNQKVKQYIDSLGGKNIHILGLSGIEGYTITKFLVKHGIKEITAHDFSEAAEFRKRFLNLHLYMPRKERVESLKKMKRWGITICLQDSYLKGLKKANLVFLPQNWFAYAENHPIIDDILKTKEISSLTKLYLDLAPCPVIGISGSMGKSSTTAMTYAMLRSIAASQTFDAQNVPSPVHKVYLGGNERKEGQFLDQLEKISEDDVIVLEISNRQLVFDLGKSPQIAVITNVVPNHIVDHGSFLRYKRVKKKLLQYQKDTDVAILNWDNEVTRSFASAYRRRSILFSSEEMLGRGVYVHNGWIQIREQMSLDDQNAFHLKILPLAGIPLLGKHNLQNLLAAVGAIFGLCRVRGTRGKDTLQLCAKSMRAAIADFSLPAGRLEFVGEADAVCYFYDIKSTIPDGTIAALAAVRSGSFASKRQKTNSKYLSGKQVKSAEIVLVAGGDEKGVNYAEFAKVVSENVRDLILLPGSGSKKIRKELAALSGKSDLNQHEVEDFDQAWATIQTTKKAGDIVLLSPACESFFSKYLAGKRGFKERVKRLGA